MNSKSLETWNMKSSDEKKEENMKIHLLEALRTK